MFLHEDLTNLCSRLLHVVKENNGQGERYCKISTRDEKIIAFLKDSGGKGGEAGL